MTATRPVKNDPLAEKVTAWWLGVLSGQRGRDHPIYGNNIRAVFKEDILRVDGVLESARACIELRREIKTLKGAGIESVDFRVRVEGPPGERGVLRQLILAFFVNDEQAGMAKRYLDGHPDVRPLRTLIAHEADAAEALAGVPEEWRRDIAAGFRGAASLLVVEVDEVEAFRANELLAETKSGKSFVLPPKPY